MLTVRRPELSLYVDRATGQWVVRDPHGALWTIPMTDNPWGDRLPYTLAEEAELEAVPGHYKNILGLPT